MKPTLLSWLDPRYDLKAETHTLDMQGMHAQAHLHWAGDYHEHILLIWKESPQQKLLVRAAEALVYAFPSNRIEMRLVSFADPLDLPAVHAQIQSLLFSLHERELHLFINPGYQMMQLSWLLCHQSMKLNTRLLQVRQARFTQSGKPELEEVEVKPSEGAHALLMQNFSHRRKEALLTPTLSKVYEKAQILATIPHPVLITGESGTGKELLAKYVHEQSHRQGGFHAVNCASVNDNLLQSTLFGHKKGAFTGADADKKGFFEEAIEGTLFLDEIGDVSPLLQQAFLRVLQDRTFHRLGDNKTRTTSSRIIAATNHHLPELIAAKTFRLDLYYRLSAFTLHLPSWRELPESERLTLLNGMNEQVAEESNRPPLVLKADAKKLLLQSRLPGNLRQLKIIFCRLYVFHSAQPSIDASAMREEIDDLLTSPTQEELPLPTLSLEEVEQWHAQRAFAHHGSRLAQTAKSLGLSVNTLKKLLG